MAARFQVFTGTPSDPSDPTSTTPTGTPSAGGPVDWIGGGAVGSLNYLPGFPFLVDTGGSFSAGDDLATDGSGRAVQAGAGDVVVARALEGSFGAGDTAWVVWAGRRTA